MKEVLETICDAIRQYCMDNNESKASLMTWDKLIEALQSKKKNLEAFNADPLFDLIREEESLQMKGADERKPKAL